MQAAKTLFEYPEFLLAGALALLFVRIGVRHLCQAHVPLWLAEPASACLMSMPERYRWWLSALSNRAGLRHARSFGDLASMKLYPAMLATAAAACLPLPVVPVLAALVFLVPDLWLLFAARRRQAQIRESLPYALDLMVLCVDAGLGLDATLKRVSAERKAIAPALNDELLNLGRDLLLGMDRERAYQELYLRTGVEELRTLGSALNQSGKLGLSIARVLRAQSEFLRTKQSQKAEEKAARLPIYMAFPLWFLIMPALMVLVLAPSLIRFFQQVGFQSWLFR